MQHHTQTATLSLRGPTIGCAIGCAIAASDHGTGCTSCAKGGSRVKRRIYIIVPDISRPSRGIHRLPGFGLATRCCVPNSRDQRLAGL